MTPSSISRQSIVTTAPFSHPPPTSRRGVNFPIHGVVCIYIHVHYTRIHYLICSSSIVKVSPIITHLHNTHPLHINTRSFIHWSFDARITSTTSFDPHQSTTRLAITHSHNTNPLFSYTHSYTRLFTGYKLCYISFVITTDIVFLRPTEV